MAEPPEKAAAQTATAVRRSARSGKMPRSSPRVEGISVAPPRPSSARAAMSIPGVVAKAAATEARPKARAPMSSSRRRPIRSPRLPMSTSSPASRNEYRSMIHSSCVELGARSALSAGTASASTVMSMLMSSTGRTSTASADQRRTGGMGHLHGTGLAGRRAGRT